jgi:photosystem II stability/assembly factor-like uncharacterized protein
VTEPNRTWRFARRAVVLSLPVSVLFAIVVSGRAILLGARPDAREPGSTVESAQVKSTAKPSHSGDHPEHVVNRINHRESTLKSDGGKIPKEAPAAGTREYSRKMTATEKGLYAGVPVGPGDDDPRTLTPPLQDEGPGRWGWLGPSNQGGRTRAILIHPKQPLVLWAGSRGGVWKSLDGGLHWMISGRTVAHHPISSLVIDPSTADMDPEKATLFAGTGEMIDDRTPGSAGVVNGTRGGGVFRSSDGGRSWQPLEGRSTGLFDYVNRLAIAPSDAHQSVLLAATEQGLFRTIDPGKTEWEKVYPDSKKPNSGESIINDVQFDPTDPLHAVATGRDPREAFLVSRDGGKTWTSGECKFEPGAEFTDVTLAFARKSSQIVYASVCVSNGAKGTKSQVWRSTDGGKTYSPRKTEERAQGGANGGNRPADYLVGRGDYYNAVWAGHPDDQDFVVVGGPELWRSTDGGDTLERITDSLLYDKQSSSAKRTDRISNLADISIHTDQHFIAGHPRFGFDGNWSAYVANDGGIFYTSDLRKAGSDPLKAHLWQERNDGFGTLTLNGGTGHALTGNVLVCAQDSGCYFHDPRAQTGWRSVGGLDNFQAVADERDPSGLRFFASQQFGTVVRFTREGRDNPVDPQFDNQSLLELNATKAAFFTPAAMDGRDPPRLYVGALELWRTDQARVPAADPDKAEVVKRAIETDPAKQDPVTQSISAIAIQPSDPTIVWVGYADGTLAYTKDIDANEPDWKKVDTEKVFPDRYITQILLPRNDMGCVYVTLGGYAGDNVWAGTYKPGDASLVSWRALGTNSLPRVPLRAIAVHPRNPRFLYVGAETGLFASDDAGGTWKPTESGPCYAAVDGLFWIESTLHAVTHGRGLFRIRIP